MMGSSSVAGQVDGSGGGLGAGGAGKRKRKARSFALFSRAVPSTWSVEEHAS